MPRALCSKEIAEEIDCSWQFVNKRADRLIENALIEFRCFETSNA